MVRRAKTRRTIDQNSETDAEPQKLWGGVRLDFDCVSVPRVRRHKWPNDDGQGRGASNDQIANRNANPASAAPIGWPTSYTRHSFSDHIQDKPACKCNW